jgi:hypothetical protein
MIRHLAGRTGLHNTTFRPLHSTMDRLILKTGSTSFILRYGSLQRETLHRSCRQIAWKNSVP